MKKVYQTPSTQIHELETSILCASSDVKLIPIHKGGSNGPTYW
jgi:hypothetical protein